MLADYSHRHKSYMYLKICGINWKFYQHIHIKHTRTLLQQIDYTHWKSASWYFMQSIKHRCMLWSVDVSSSDAFDRNVFLVSSLSDNVEVSMCLSPSSSENAPRKSVNWFLRLSCWTPSLPELITPSGRIGLILDHPKNGLWEWN